MYAHGPCTTARKKQRVVVFQANTASSKTIKLKLIFCLYDLLTRAHRITPFKILLSLNQMFKYQNFPLLLKEFYDDKGVLKQKMFRMKSNLPVFENSHYSIVNVIDVETSKNLTLKQIFKNKSLSKLKTLQEIQNQQTMNFHENFIKLEEVFEDKENVYLLMEENGPSLEQLLESRKYFLQKEVQYIFCQLVTIIENLRKKNIAHGEITLHELYLNPQTMKIKLGGFYKSYNIKKVVDEVSTLGPNSQPTGYTSPQLLGINSDDYEVYYSNDIWSVGVILFTLLTGKQPYLHLVQSKKRVAAPALQKIKKCSFEFSTSIKISTVWKELIKKIFQPKEKRITLKELIWHPLNHITQSWFTSLDKINPPPINHHQIQAYDYTFEQKNELPYYNQVWNLNFKVKKTSLGKQSKKERVVKFAKEEDQNEDFCPSMDSSISEVYEKVNVQNVLKTILQRISETLPLIVNEPQKIQKYFLFEDGSLGYILNKSIGVLYTDGNCIIGHNEQEFRYIDHESGETSCGKILIASQKSIPKSFNKIKSAVSKVKLSTFRKFIDLFGERVVFSELNLWVVKYWKVNNIAVFLMNSGLWQLNFQQGIEIIIVIIDKYDLGWLYSSNSLKVQNFGLVKIARDLVRRLREKVATPDI